MQPGGFKLETKREVKAPKQISKWEEIMSLTLRQTAEPEKGLRFSSLGSAQSQLRTSLETNLM